MSASVKVEAPVRDSPFQTQFVEVDCQSPGLLGDFSNVWKTIRTAEDIEERDPKERFSVIHKAEEVNPVHGGLGDFRNIWTFLQAIKDGNLEQHKDLFEPAKSISKPVGKSTTTRVKCPSSRKSAFTKSEPPKRMRSDLDISKARLRKLESSDSSDSGDGKTIGVAKKDRFTILKKVSPEPSAKETLKIGPGKTPVPPSAAPMGESPKVKVKKTVPLTKSFSGNERPVQSRKGTDSTKGSVTVKGNLKLYSLPEQKKKIVSLLPGQERKQIVLQSLLKKFPADESTLRSPYHPSRPFASSEPGIHIFIDNSNIIIGFYQALKRVFSLSENTPTYRPNFDFHTFSFILERGRRTSTKCLVGSLPSTAAIVEAENLGYTTNLLTRVEKQQAPVTKPGSPKSAGKKLPNDSPKKTEQAVDEIISLKMALTLLDNADCPSTLVLASGDAAQGEFSDGFRSVVERFLKAGWKVEVMSFRNCLGNGYRQKEWGERWGDRFRVVELDGYVEAFLADEDVMGV